MVGAIWVDDCSDARIPRSDTQIHNYSEVSYSQSRWECQRSIEQIGVSGRTPEDMVKELGRKGPGLFLTLTPYHFREYVQPKSLIQIPDLLWNLGYHTSILQIDMVDLAILE